MKKERVSLARFKELVGEGAEAGGKVLVAKAMPITVSKGCFPWLDDEDKAIEPAEGSLDFIASTGAVDREGDIIEPSGWDLENFRKGGTFLWAHDSSLPPIGKPLNVGVEDGKLMLRVQFTPADMDHPLGKGFGDTIRRMYEEGFMRAVSVGFGPNEVEFAEDREDAGFMPMNFIRQELQEVSAVPVPANPEALHVAQSKGINVGHLYNWAEEVKACGMSSEALTWASKSWANDLLSTYKSGAIMVPETLETEEPEVADVPAVEDTVAEIKAIEDTAECIEDEPVVEIDAEAEAELEAALEAVAERPLSEETVDSILCAYDNAVDKSVAAEKDLVNKLCDLAATVAKQGRVLSAANERKLREAFDLLSSVLSAVAPEEEGKEVEPETKGCGCEDTEDKGLSEDEFRKLIEKSVKDKLSAFVADVTGQLAE